jgi:Copper amine oxidase, N2 domain
MHLTKEIHTFVNAAGWHPLDALTPEEISQSAAACRKRGTVEGLTQIRFNTITLKEPAKAALLAYEKDTTQVERQSFCILQVPGAGDVYEVVLTLSNAAAAKVTSWVSVEGVQPLITPEDCFDAEAIVKADPQIQALLKDKYAITDMDMVVCDPWSVHLPPFAGRLVQVNTTCNCFTSFMHSLQASCPIVACYAADAVTESVEAFTHTRPRLCTAPVLLYIHALHRRSCTRGEGTQQTTPTPTPLLSCQW